MNQLDRLTGRFLWWLVSLGLTPARWPLSACGTVILEVPRRRSGGLQSTLVTWAEHGGKRYLVTMPGKEPQWAKNMRAGGNEVVLRHGRRQTRAVLREVPVDQRPPILQVWYRTTSRSSHPRQHFKVDRDAHIDEFARLAAAHPVYLIEPRA